MNTEDNKKPPAAKTKKRSKGFPAIEKLPEGTPPEKELRYLKLLIDIIELTSPVERYLTYLCLQADEPAADGFGNLLDELRDFISRNPSAKDELCEKLKVEPPKPEDIEKEWGGQVAIILILLEKEEQARIALAFEHPEKRDELTFFEKHLLDLLIATNGLQRIDEPDKTHKDTLTPDLPGLEPEPETKPEEVIDAEAVRIGDKYVVTAPPYEYHTSTSIPISKLFRESGRLKFVEAEDGYITAKIGVDGKRPHEQHVYIFAPKGKEGEYPVKQEDRNILMAVGNLYDERQGKKRFIGIGGGVIVTAEDIVRRYQGLHATDRIDQNTLDEVAQRMEALTAESAFEIDFSEEKIGLFEADPRKEGKYEYRNIHANKITITRASGRTEKAWEIQALPMLYRYSKEKKQVATVPTSLLNIGGDQEGKRKVYNANSAANMRTELTTRILYMIDSKTHKQKQGVSHSINLERFFATLGISFNNRESKRKTIKTLTNILDHFTTQPDPHRGRFISGYDIIKGRRGAVESIKIKLDVVKDEPKPKTAAKAKSVNNGSSAKEGTQNG